MSKNNIDYYSYHYFVKNETYEFNLKKKDSKFLFTFLIAFLFLLICSLITYLNIFLITKQKLKFSELITILIFDLKKPSQNQEEEVLNITEIGLINKGIWICLASIIASIALSISACCTQSLSQNYIADPTTLGFIDAIIFGIIFLKTILVNVISSDDYIFYIIFSFLGGILILLILIPLFFKSNNKKKNLNLIFIGLIMGIMFKAFSNILKTYNINSVTTSFALAIGGAENIYSLYSEQFSVLKLAFFSILIVFFLAWISSKKFNLFELGEDNAKTMGLNIKLFKFINYIFLLITNTVGIVLVGNIAFLGLLSIHIVRTIFKTRKYQIIIPMSSIFSSVLLLIGVLLNSLFPFISSSIFVLFCGAIMLLYLTLSSKEDR